MKIVQIEDFFNPESGYQINILSKYFSRFGHDVTIITSSIEKMPDFLKNYFENQDIREKDREFEKKYGVRIIRLPIKAYISGRSVFSLVQLLKQIKKLNPDVVYAHGNDTLSAIMVFLFHKKIPCRIVSDTHMVDIASSNKFRKWFRLFYKKSITPIIIRRKIPVIRTSDSDYVMRCFDIPKRLSPIITFGSDTMLFHPDQMQRNQFRKENNIASDAFVIVYAGKLDKSKGGLLLSELTYQKIKVDREIVFVIIGNTVGEYGKKVEDMLKQSPSRVLRFPTQKYEELPSFFQAADVALIPKACSLTFYDYQACGLPVIAENNVTNIQRCNEGVGTVFSQDDVADFVEKIESYAKMSNEELGIQSQLAAKRVNDLYNYYNKAKEYEKVLIATKSNE